MNILITMQKSPLRDQFFPEHIMTSLRAIGNVRMNEYGRTMTETELAEELRDIDICMTHSWLGCPTFDEYSLRNAHRLRMIAHVCASVGRFLTDEVYNRGIKVSSANKIMAKYVAEGTLAYMLSALRHIPQHDQAMKQGNWMKYDKVSLFGRRIAFVGLGTVGRFLLELLRPWNITARIYDPYIQEEDLLHYPEAELVRSLPDVLSWGDLVTVHASRTNETHHLLNGQMLSMMKDGAILVNTSRGELIDEQALTAELSSGRISAVLDVFTQEPLPLDSELRKLKQVILQPHCAGDTDYAGYTMGLVDEIRRYMAGEPLQLEISHKQFQRMTV
ncbi:hydroxyacid dehydrogenase [Paenibacillus sp. GCM10023252]|uniref:hydroxyacid dehydrogenase n=1 Tax=Paenibacillus sp. GCM10023252 TaxID=3252649 RepID=UPI0036155C23